MKFYSKSIQFRTSQVLLLSICLTTIGLSQFYTTDFNGTENPISEGGAWSHAGLDWAKVQKSGGIAFGSQSGTGGYDDSYARLSGYPADQTAWGVVYVSGSTATTCSHEVEILLRWADSTHTARGYECNLSVINIWGGYYMEIVRWNGPFGIFTPLARQFVSGVKTGDTLKATAIGNVITSYFNGVKVCEVTDTVFKTGNPGIAMFRRDCGANTDHGFTSFTATGNSVGAEDRRQIKEAKRLSLDQIYLDFNKAGIAVEYSVPSKSFVTIKVSDVRGREIGTLVNEWKTAGNYSARIGGTGLAAGGVYVVTMRVDGRIGESRRITRNVSYR